MKSMLRATFMLVLAAMTTSAFAQSYNLNLALRTQEHSQWCWTTSAQMILNYFGKNPTQCGEVNWTLGINYACGNTTFDWNSPANKPNSCQAIANILNRWSVSANFFAGYYSQANLQSRINARKPFVVLWTWTAGGGHFVVCKGYSGSYVYLNDPWPGNGAYTRTYASTVSASDRKWTYTVNTN